jgi:hypothetical protein
MKKYCHSHLIKKIKLIFYLKSVDSIPRLPKTKVTLIIVACRTYCILSRNLNNFKTNLKVK